MYTKCPLEQEALDIKNDWCTSVNYHSSCKDSSDYTIPVFVKGSGGNWFHKCIIPSDLDFLESDDSNICNSGHYYRKRQIRYYCEENAFKTYFTSCASHFVSDDICTDCPAMTSTETLTVGLCQGGGSGDSGGSNALQPSFLLLLLLLVCISWLKR